MNKGQLMIEQGNRSRRLTIRKVHHALQRSRVLALTASLSLTLCSSCLVGPDFHSPRLNLPSQWAGPVSGSNETTESPGKEYLARWWLVFNDPTLVSLVERAAGSNLDLQIAEARIRQARASRAQVASGLGPTINMSSSFQHAQSQVYSSPSAGSGPENAAPTAPTNEVLATTDISDQTKVGFDSSWEIDFFGKVRRGIEAADSEIDVALEARRDVLVALMAEVARNYVDLRSFQQRAEVARLNLKSQEKSVELTRRRHSGGFASRLDVTYAEAQAATTAGQIPLLESAAQQAIYNISVLLGQEPAALLEELSEIAQIPAGPPSVPVGVPSELLRRRPDIRRAEAQIHAATARIGVAVADLYPQFTIGGSVGYQSLNIGSLVNPSSLFWSIGPSVNWNLFKSGKTMATIEQQKALRDQSMISYQQTVLTALKEVENALIASLKEEEHRKALATAVEANQESVKLATILYTNGQADFLSVLLAQRSAYLSEDALIQSTRTISLNLIALFKGLGGGWDWEKETVQHPVEKAK